MTRMISKTARRSVTGAGSKRSRFRRGKAICPDTSMRLQSIAVLSGDQARTTIGVPRKTSKRSFPRKAVRLSATRSPPSLISRGGEDRARLRRGQPTASSSVTITVVRIRQSRPDSLRTLDCRALGGDGHRLARPQRESMFVPPGRHGPADLYFFFACASG
jgi:hypothetical protein